LIVTPLTIAQQNYTRSSRKRRAYSSIPETTSSSSPLTIVPGYCRK
jgi:hypothetical protein